MSWRKPVIASLGVVSNRLRSLDNRLAKLRVALSLPQDFKVRHDDIFAVSFPKSGTTVLQMLLYQLTTEGWMDFPHISAVVPWFDVECERSNYGFLEGIDSPRAFKSHAVYQVLPRGARYVYVARNLRSVAVSAFYHHCLASGTEHDMEKYLDEFIKGRSGFGNWYEHIKSWWPHRNDPDVLFLTYESLVGDLEGTLRRVVRFLGLPLEEVRVPLILERCSLASMKKHNEKFDPRLHHTSWRRNSFIREGRTDGWKTHLSTDQDATIRERLTALAKDLACPPEEPLAELFYPQLAAGR